MSGYVKLAVHLDLISELATVKSRVAELEGAYRQLELKYKSALADVARDAVPKCKPIVRRGEEESSGDIEKK